MTTTRFQAPRGTQDVLPAGQPYWTAIHDAIREVARLFGFQRIDTPAFEPAGVFEKGSGDTTDVVEKEMYTFEDRGGERLALAPEGTPAIVRAYLEHGMASWPQPVRLFTTKHMFRYDRPQRGRYRQHTQFDCEIIGSAEPLADFEVIHILWSLYARLGLRNLTVHLNSIDDPEPRRSYVERLKDHFRPHFDQLSEDSKRRFDRNPLRLLDSKEPQDEPFKQGAPTLIDSLSEPARLHHEQLTAALSAAGIPFTTDPFLVRGLDYYNRTVFEIVPDDDERAQGTVGGGGRYDGLAEVLGGPHTPGVGFGSGFERIILEMQKYETAPAESEGVHVFVVQRGGAALAPAVRLVADLREAGISALLGETGRSFKSQFRSADSAGARLALIVGEDEVARGMVGVKSLREQRDQTEEPLDAIIDTVQNLLNGNAADG